jgi:Zn-dependent protease
MTIHYVIIAFQIVAFLFAISVHESAHAWTANRYGDPTATMLGRVTLNPIKHIDPIGTVLFPIIAAVTGLPMIGWAKPTPVDTRNFKEPVKADIMTSVAGPVSNFIVAIGALAVLLIMSKTSAPGSAVVQNLASRQLILAGSLTPLALMFYTLMQINILLGIFNLIPIPPLDGSHVLRHALSENARHVYDRIGIFGLIVLMIFGGRFLGSLISPVVGFFDGILRTV